MDEAARLHIGVSLKMYFSKSETLRWCALVAEIAARHPAITTGTVEFFVLPSFPMIPFATSIFADTRVQVGAQNLHSADRGAYTGEVGGLMLRELGCRYVEVGHAERRALFHEDDNIVAAKTAAALRNRLTAVLCVGEQQPTSSQQAALSCIAEVERALTASPSDLRGKLVVAYEPRWAIGATEPAGPQHIRVVGGVLRDWLAAHATLTGSRVIYGGSAGPGLLGQLSGSVDGLFLGRFAHDTAAVEAVLDEAWAVTSTSHCGGVSGST